jgi:hypothetical protein
VIRIFGPNTELALAFLARLPDLSPEDIGQVTDAWRQTNGLDRAQAWVQVHRVATDRERCWIVAASSVARQVALDAASRYRWTDWAFSAASSDAGAAIVADDRIGSHYETLISPLAAVMPWLPPAHGEAQSAEDVPDSVRRSGDVLRQGAQP